MLEDTHLEENFRELWASQARGAPTLSLEDVPSIQSDRVVFVTMDMTSVKREAILAARHSGTSWRILGQIFILSQ